jgi:phage tail-like protein
MATFQLAVNGSRPGAPTDAPSTASARQHLRRGVPDIYRRDFSAREDQPPPFAIRFLHALEEVLDPIIATLDSLPAHLDVDLAPEHALAGLATWLGVDDVEALPAKQRREAVRRAGELARTRGTREGLELALSLFFPDNVMRVNDHGGMVVSESVDSAPPPAATASFDVVCEQSLPPETQMAVARCIESWKPVHAHYKLRVRKGKQVKTMPDVPTVSTGGVTPRELRPPFVEPPERPSEDDP